MPTVSQFFGIIIRMYFDEHAPPHFHAIYAEYEAAISIDSLEVVRGSMPRRALALVLEWASLHREELRENWRLAEAQEQLRRIQPLE